MNYQDAMQIMTPAQFNQLVEMIQLQQELSKTRGCNQTLEIVFKDGHMKFLNASNNHPTIPHGLVMGEDYAWRQD